MNLADQIVCKMIIDAWRFEKKRYVIIENDTFGKSIIILAKSIINERIDERKINNKRTTRTVGSISLSHFLLFLLLPRQICKGSCTRIIDSRKCLE